MNGRIPKAAFIFGAVALLSLISNVLMGATIFANVIAVAIAALSAFVGTGIASIQLFRKKGAKMNLVALILNATLLSLSVWLFAAQKVPAGYGP